MSKPFYITGGTLPQDASSYVSRQADTDLLNGLRGGEFCYVLNTRQMGKSSLMIRTANQLKAEGCRVAILDLTAAGKNLSVEQWYCGLLNRVGMQIGQKDSLLAFWKSAPELGPMQRFMEGLHLLLTAKNEDNGIHDEYQKTEDRRQKTYNRQSHPPPLVLFVDEIDAVRSLPFSADEFFAGVRECYNRRAQEPEFARLTFCLLGVATPADLIQDTRTTPFNIGRRIELRDFTPEEAAPLAAGLVPPASSSMRRNPRSWAPRLLKRVLYWTNGHPYMTQRLCREIAEQQTLRMLAPADVDKLCDRLFLSRAAQEGDDNLAFVRNRLLKSEADLPTILDFYGQVRARRHVRDDETNPLCGILLLSGAAAAERGFLRVRNRIYNHVFDRQWIRDHMPDAELQRQRRAYRHGLYRATIVGGLATLVMTCLTAWAIHSRSQAQEALGVARKERLSAQIEKRKALAANEQERKQRLAALQAKLLANQSASRADQNAHNARQSAHHAAQSAEAAKRALAKAQSAGTLAQREQRRADQRARDAQNATNRAYAATQQAKHATQMERTERDRSDTMLYAADMLAASEALDQRDFTRTAMLLQEHIPHSRHDTDRRGYDWTSLWDELNQATNLTGHTGEVQGAFKTPSELITLDSNLDLRSWNCADGKLAFTRSLRQPSITNALLAPGGQVVALFKPHALILRDTATFAVLVEIPIPAERLAWKFAANGRYLAFASSDGALLILNTLTGSVQYQLTGFAHHLSEPIALSADGRMLAVGGVRGAASLYNLERRTEAQAFLCSLPERPFPGHSIDVTGVAFSPDDKYLATSDWSGSVVLWDIAAHREIRRIKPPDFNVSHELAFSPDGKLLAVGRNYRHLFLWEWSANRIVKTLATDPDQCRFVAFSQDGHALAAGSNNGSAQIWDVSRLTRNPTLPMKAPHYARGAFSPDGKLFAITTNEGKVALWDTQSWTQLADIALPQGASAGLAFAPDGRELAIGSTNRRIYLWSIASARITQTITDLIPIGPEFAGAWSLAYSPNSKYLAAGEGAGASYPGFGDYGVLIWDRHNNKPATLLHHSYPVPAVIFSPDSRQLVTGCHDNLARIWSAEDWKLLRQIVGPHEKVTALSYAPNGRSLAIASWGVEILLIDPQTGRTQKSLSGHRNGIYSMDFSPDSRTLVSASDDKTIRLWDVSSGKNTRILQGHTDGAKFVRFSPIGTSIVSAGADNVVRIWTSATQKAIDQHILRESPGRNLNSALQNARLAETGGHWQEVIAACTGLVQQKPDLMEARQLRGRAWAEKGDYGRALPDLGEVVRMRGSKDDYYLYAFAAYLSGDAQLYRNICSNLVRSLHGVYADDLLAHLPTLALARQSPDVLERLLPYLETKWSNHTLPDWAQAIYGRALYHAQRYSAALECLETTVRLHPSTDTAENRVTIALAAQALQRRQEASIWRKKAVERLSPASPQAYWTERSLINLLTNQLQTAHFAQ